MAWPRDAHRPALAAIILFAAAAATVLSGCAATETGSGEQIADSNDPAEPVNRAIFDANMTADRAVVKPVAKAYQELPAELRQSVRNVTANLREPSVTANDLLQGNLDRAWVSAQRFAVNTTVGVAGVADVAADLKLPPHQSDFGETLAVWGVGEGPYLQLPALGPSTLRDAVGTAVGMAFDPLSLSGVQALTYLGYARTGAEYVDSRGSHIEDLDDLEHNSLDFYASLRSIYLQHRRAEIDKARQQSAPQ
jgi:phospholipid-binding lipoprotein MlaA